MSEDFTDEFAVGENIQNKVEVYHKNEINNDLNNMEANIAELIKQKISKKKYNWLKLFNFDIIHNHLIAVSFQILSLK